jgi:hypothetical protein
MENFQNQYGAVPISNNDLVRREIMGTTTTGIDGGGSTQVIGADDHFDTNIAADTNTTPTDGVVISEGENNHHKKGIIDKIKEKLPGTHHHK